VSRPRNTELEADGSIGPDFLQFWAHRALTRGFSHGAVAQRLRVPEDLIRRWAALGRPFRWQPLLEKINSAETPAETEPSVTIESR
jgi:hypothetical protein